MDIADNLSSVLVSAIYNGWAEITRTMIDDRKKYNVNKGTSNAFTPLMACAIRGNVKCAQSLLQNGADKTLKDLSGRNTLWYAVLFNRTEFAKFLLESQQEAQVKCKDAKFKMTPLHLAALNGNENILEMIGKSNLNSRDYRSRKPDQLLDLECSENCFKFFKTKRQDQFNMQSRLHELKDLERFVRNELSTLEKGRQRSTYEFRKKSGISRPGDRRSGRPGSGLQTKIITFDKRKLERPQSAIQSRCNSRLSSYSTTSMPQQRTQA